MMDFHAHMDRNEVIGLLAGSWDPQQVRPIDAKLSLFIYS
jgi:hypothetical protein